MAKKTGAGFEELLAASEEIVDALEGGGLGLEESLKLYEKGVENLRQCAQLLEAAETKVKILVEKTQDAFELADFEEPAGEAAD